MSWINITERCNNRCVYCYAKNSLHDRTRILPTSSIKKIFDKLRMIGVTKCILIGGEPTLHPDILDIYTYGRKVGLKIGMVSNGTRFADNAFSKKFVEAGLKSRAITLSMHASSSSDSFALTRLANYFQLFNNGFNNLRLNGVIPSINITISKANKDKLLVMMNWVKKQGMKEVHFNLGGPSVSQSYIDSTYVLTFKELAQLTEKIYTYGKQIKLKTFFLFLIPFCALPRKLYNALKKEKLISSGCSVRSGSAILFNVEGNVVVCNHLLDFSVMKNKTFHDIVDHKTFDKQWNSPPLLRMRNKLCVYRLKECKTCTEIADCEGGGCPLFWLKKQSANANAFFYSWNKGGEKL